VTGLWVGKGAAQLSLAGRIKRDDFLSLYDNLNPTNDERLTQRHKAVRQELTEQDGTHKVANRRVLFDFTFSPAKSASVAGLVGEDSRIVQAHDHAVQVPLAELEQFATTRVHQGSRISDCTNLASRPSLLIRLLP
jgi:conjugative relaxase-like TrwC/TraI family protein